MTCTEHLTTELRARGFRMTPQRTAILGLLHDSPGHFSPAEVYARVRTSLAGVTETTVYRTLEFLARNRMVASTLTADGHLVYEIAGHAHHHVLCRACGQSVEIDHALLARMFDRLEASTGYRLTAGHLTFFGLCPDCRGDGSGRQDA
jgi:Fe2+ or Zn2+ uptake regulation protein